MARTGKLQEAFAKASATLSLALLGPCAHAGAVDFDVAIGIPRIAFTGAGSELTRSMMVTAETSLLRADVSTTFCEQSIAARTPSFDTRGACASRSTTVRDAGEGAQMASLTMMLPRPTSHTAVELALVSWRNAAAGDSTRGTDAELRMLQSWRRLDIALGHSEPVSSAPRRAWRSTWMAAGMRISPRARLQLAAERSYEITSKARDLRTTASLSYALTANLRGSLHIVRAGDDPVRPWRAGAGLSGTF